MPGREPFPLLIVLLAVLAAAAFAAVFVLRRRHPAGARDEARFQVQIRARRAELAQILDGQTLDTGCLPRALDLPDGTSVFQAIIDGRTLRMLRSRGVEVRVLVDLEREAERLRPYLATGDRFDGGSRGWPALGRLVEE